jgi:hypothetical protein
MGSFSTTIMNRISTTARQCNATLLPGMRPAPARAEDKPDHSGGTRGGPQPHASHTGGSEKAARRRAAFSLSPLGNVPLEAAAQAVPAGPVLHTRAAEK